MESADAPGGNDVTVYLTVGEAGDGAANDHVIWQQPRLVAPGRPDILLRNMRSLSRQLAGRRDRVFAATAKSLLAADEASRADDPLDIAALAAKHGIEADALQAWLEYLGISSSSEATLNHLTNRIERSGGFEFVRGWGTQETPNLVTNSSDQHVRIPGNLPPHGVAVHPSPTLNVAVGWKSPVAGRISVAGKVTHAHPECGNGVTWAVELRRGRTRQTLANGVAAGEAPVAVRPDRRPGDSR